MTYSAQEVEEALEQLVAEGKLHKYIGKDGQPRYIENTFAVGYAQALKDIGVPHKDKIKKEEKEQ